MKKIIALDGVRGLASLLVLWAHFPLLQGGILFKYFHLGSRAIYAGYIGVDIFFALSGFLITRILLWEKEHDRFSYANFYFKRFIRIFPVYYLVILLVGVIISWSKLQWSALYLSNYYFAFNSDENPLRHTWSLCVEQHFYMFWPFIISYFNVKTSRKIITYIIPAIAIVSAALSLIYFTNGVEIINRVTNVRILTLCFGSLLAFYETNLETKSVKVPLILAIIFFVCTCACHLITNVPLQSFFRFIFSAAFSVFSLMSVLILSFQGKFPKMMAFLDSQIMRFFGKISYGLYLFHLPILMYFGVSHMDNPGSVSLKLGLFLLTLCVVIPTISFYFFEKPLLKIKNKFTVIKGQV